MSLRDIIAELDANTVLYDGCDDALIGFSTRCGQPLIAIYSRQKLVEVFTKQGMTAEEADEHIEYNIIGAWLGDRTPAVVEGERLVEEPPPPRQKPAKRASKKTVKAVRPKRAHTHR